MTTFQSAAASYVGARQQNEDSGFAGSALLVIADGVGGHASGEVASAVATLLTVNTFAAGGDDLPHLLREAVANAHLQIRRSVERDPQHAGMATTLTVVALGSELSMLLHIGDSRCYRLRERRLEQLTRDHTLYEAMRENAGPEFSTRHNGHFSSVILRALDHVQPPEPDLQRIDLKPGDRLLLCSDGLSDVLPAARIQSLLREGPAPAVADRLVSAALEAGGRDNITAVVAELVDGEAAEGDAGSFVGAAADPHNLQGCDSVSFLTARREIPLY